METETYQEDAKQEVEEERAISDLEFEDQVMDLELHSKQNVVAVGLITGALKLYRYDEEKPHQLLYDLSVGKKSCRALRFSADGNCKSSTFLRIT